jgi:hypothetical protein
VGFELESLPQEEFFGFSFPQGERSIFGFFSRNRRGADFEVGANRKLKFII